MRDHRIHTSDSHRCAVAHEEGHVTVRPPSTGPAAHGRPSRGIWAIESAGVSATLGPAARRAGARRRCRHVVRSGARTAVDKNDPRRALCRVRPALCSPPRSSGRPHRALGLCQRNQISGSERGDLPSPRPADLHRRIQGNVRTDAIAPRGSSRTPSSTRKLPVAVDECALDGVKVARASPPSGVGPLESGSALSPAVSAHRDVRVQRTIRRLYGARSALGGVVHALARERSSTRIHIPHSPIAPTRRSTSTQGARARPSVKLCVSQAPRVQRHLPPAVDAERARRTLGTTQPACRLSP